MATSKIAAVPTRGCDVFSTPHASIMPQVWTIVLGLIGRVARKWNRNCRVIQEVADRIAQPCGSH